MTDNLKPNSLSNVKLQKRYLFASASAVAAAFISVNLYPEQHGMAATPLITRIILSSAILALFIYIIVKAYSAQEIKTEDEQKLLQQKADLLRQKKMFLIWSAFTVLLCAPLVQHPFETFQALGINNMGLKEIFSMSSAIALTAYTALSVIIHFKNGHNKL